MLLTGRVAVVAGVGPGMGRDIALALSAHGAAVALGARAARHVDPVVDEIRDRGGRAVGLPTDVTDPADCVALARAAHDSFGGIDVLVNNAAHGGTFGRLSDTEPVDLLPVLEVNVLGTLAMTNAVVPHLRARGGGRIVMVNTNTAEVPLEGFGGYGMSKAALLHVTAHLAVELGRDGIRVNSVLPGPIWGRNLRRWFESLAAERGVRIEDIVAEQAATTLLGYIPTSEEIAGTVVYLASDLSRPVTGQTIRADCGQWMTPRQPG